MHSIERDCSYRYTQAASYTLPASSGHSIEAHTIMTDSLFNVEEFQSDSAEEPMQEPGTTTASEAVQLTSMSAPSLSLYRKYRPGSFASDELFGQEHVVNTLKNAIRLDRIGHAYLFCGPRGTGKTTTARILAKAVNCLEPDPGDRPCNHCDACNAINANATTDVIEIDAASNRGIDDIRELRERVKYAPTMLRTKFYIIDEAHQITGAAANAFLKTLEEPPAHTKFVLATTDPEELLQTIISRCQRFDFRRIGLDAMRACLIKVADAEQIEVEPDALTTIARHATGSLRDALGLLDQVAVYRDESDSDTSTVTTELVRTVLGISRNDRVEGLVRAIADHDPGAGLTIINQAVEAGDDVRQLGRQLVSYLRILMLERASGSPDADDTARELTRRLELGELARIARILADVDYKSRHSSIAQLPLELAVIQASLVEEAQTTVSTGAAAQHRQSASDGAVRRDDTPPATEPAPAPPPRQKGPSLKDRVRGASMPRGESPTADQREGTQEPQPDRPYNASDGTPVTSEGPNQKPQGEEQSASNNVSDGAAAPPATSPGTGTPDAGGGDLERIVGLWDNIRMDVKALNRRTEALLQQADPVQVENSHLTLVAAYPFHQKRLNDDDTRKVIEDVIERLSGTRMTVSSISREEAQQLRSRTSASTAPTTSTQQAQPPAQQSGPRERARSGSRTDSQSDDDDIEPDPPPLPDYELTDPEYLDAPNSTGADPDSAARDEERIKAAINIFDAVVVDDDR